jgi:signal transduction histidine kinase
MLVSLFLSALLLRYSLARDFETRLRAMAQDFQTGISLRESQSIDLGDAAPEGAFNERFSGWYWMVSDGDVIIARSRSLVTETIALGEPSLMRDISGPQDVPLLAISLPVRGRQGLSVTVAGPKHAVYHALISDLWVVLGGVFVLGVVLMLVTWSQVNRALAPLQRLTSDLGRLMGGNIATLPPFPFSELNAVVVLINSLLDDGRERVKHARDAAAKLAHGLKTPLALLAARSGVGGTNPDGEVVKAVDSMRYLIDQNLKVARAARASLVLSEPVPVKCVIDDLVFAFTHMFRGRHLSVRVEIGDNVAFQGSKDDLQEMIGNLLENAYMWAAADIDITVNRTEVDGLKVLVCDDGPGFPSAVLEGQLQLSPAVASGRQNKGSTNIGGLGLEITREIAARYGGRLDLANAVGKGAKATLTLP